MAFPSITYKATNTELDTGLQSILEGKLHGLEKHLTKAGSTICEVEFIKETAHQSGRHFKIEVNCTIDGHLHRAEATEESFERSIDEVVNELDKQLRRRNDKETTLERQGGRELKAALQNPPA